MNISAQFVYIWDHLSTMDVPAMRTDLNQKENVRWLIRNLPIRNAEHPQIKLVLAGLTELAGEQLDADQQARLQAYAEQFEREKKIAWLSYLDKLSDHELDVEHDGHFEGRDLGAMM